VVTDRLQHPGEIAQTGETARAILHMAQNLVDLVALAALFQLLVFGFLVGSACGRYGVMAPADTGHEMFERAYRVQMNTLELMVLFIPARYLAARYWPPAWVAALGAVYVVGRLLYRVAYLRQPASHGLGFLASIVPIFMLLAAGVVGAVRGLL
jgi:glutathione S-transferase